MSDTFMTIAYAFAAGSIGFALAMALGQRSQRSDRVLFFCLLLVALLAHVLGQLLVVSDAYELAPHLVGAELAIKTALGPGILFYVRALTSRVRPGFGGRDWLCLVAPALVVLVSLPLASLSAEEKLALVDPATRDPDHWRLALFTCTATLIVFLGTTGIYLVAALRLQGGHRRRMMHEFANIERRSLDWLRLVLAVFVFAWLMYAVKQVFWLTGTSIPALNMILASTESLAIAAFAYLGLHQPDLPSDEPANRSAPDVTSPGRRPILSEDRLSRTAQKLTLALNTNKLYADSELSLRRLSDITGVTKNHISETLSQKLGINFFDFVNSHRAAEAKRLLVETELSVLEIGLEVGFNSRSTFNAAFNKHAGSTPSAYRAKARDLRSIDAKNAAE